MYFVADEIGQSLGGVDLTDTGGDCDPRARQEGQWAGFIAVDNKVAERLNQFTFRGQEGLLPVLINGLVLTIGKQQDNRIQVFFHCILAWSVRERDGF